MIDIIKKTHISKIFLTLLSVNVKRYYMYVFDCREKKRNI